MSFLFPFVTSAACSPVALGGTGNCNFVTNTILLGNGTSALSTTTTGINGQFLSLVGGTPTWASVSNSGATSTNPLIATYFIATTTNKENVFGGNSVFGTSAIPTGATFNDIIDAATSTNDFVSIGVWNTNSGACATSEFDANNNISNLTNNFTALGITGGSFTGMGCANTPYTGFSPNDTYLLNPNGNVDFALGTTTSTGQFKWFTGGYAAANLKMILTEGGFLGIGSTTPDSPITISNNLTSFAAPQTGTELHIAGSGINSRITVDTYNAGVTGAIFQGRTAAGTNLAPLPPIIDQTLGGFAGDGYGTTGFHNVSLGGLFIKTESVPFTNTSAATYLGFYTTPTTTISSLERMRISSTGNVGIGTTTPQTKLSITGTGTGNDTPTITVDAAATTNGNADFALNRASGGTSEANIDFNTAWTNKWQLGMQNSGTSGDNFQIWDGNDNQAFTITSANRFIGIGTSTPTNRLEVAGNTFLGGNLTATGTVSFTAQGTGCASFTSGVLSALGSACATGLGYTAWGGSIATTMGTTTIASTTPAWFKTGLEASSTSNLVNATFWGNVGIGTTSQLKALTVEGSTANGVMNVIRDGGAAPTGADLTGLFTLQTSSTGFSTADGPGISFRLATSTPDNSGLGEEIASIYALRDGNDKTGDLELLPAKNGVTANTFFALFGNAGIASIATSTDLAGFNVQNLGGQTDAIHFSSALGAPLLKLTNAGVLTINQLGSGAVSAASGVLSAGTLSIANGGTNATSCGTTGGVWYYDGTRFVCSSNLTFTATGNLLTVSNATTTNLTIATSLGIPSSSSQAPTLNGYLAQDTTNDQIVIGDGTVTSVFDKRIRLSLSYATTTAWTGTTTLPAFPITQGITWTQISCTSQPGGSTIDAQYQYANPSTYATVNSTMVVASTTPGLITLSSNNVPATQATSTIQFGTPASSPTSASCTLVGTATAT